MSEVGELSSVAQEQISLVHRQANYLLTSFFAIFLGISYFTIEHVRNGGFDLLAAMTLTVLSASLVQIHHLLSVHHDAVDSLISSKVGFASSPSILPVLLHPGIGILVKKLSQFPALIFALIAIVILLGFGATVIDIFVFDLLGFSISSDRVRAILWILLIIYSLSSYRTKKNDSRTSDSDE